MQNGTNPIVIVCIDANTYNDSNGVNNSESVNDSKIDGMVNSVISIAVLKERCCHLSQPISYYYSFDRRMIVIDNVIVLVPYYLFSLLLVPFCGF